MSSERHGLVAAAGTRYDWAGGHLHGNQRKRRPSPGRGFRPSWCHGHLWPEPAKRVSPGGAACRDQAGGIPAGKRRRGHGGRLCPHIRPRRRGDGAERAGGHASGRAVGRGAEGVDPDRGAGAGGDARHHRQERVPGTGSSEHVRACGEVGPPHRPRRPAGRLCRHGLHRRDVRAAGSGGDPGAGGSAGRGCAAALARGRRCLGMYPLDRMRADPAAVEQRRGSAGLGRNPLVVAGGGIHLSGAYDGTGGAAGRRRICRSRPRQWARVRWTKPIR